MENTQDQPYSAERVNKLQRWQQLEAKFAQMTDGLGKPIDAGIMQTVIGLNAVLEDTGVTTRQSCEGHLDWGSPAPWVDFEIDKDPVLGEEYRVLETRRLQLAEAIDKISEDSQESEALTKLYEEYHKVRKQVERIRAEQNAKIHKLLEDFYQHRLREVSYDQLLIYNGRRLQSLGADYQSAYDDETKAANLARYQEEMRQLADFLKNRFMTS